MLPHQAANSLIGHVHSRITADRVMRLGLGVVFPQSTMPQWSVSMCKGPGEPDTSNADLANINKLVADLKEKGLISAERPIATWGFSSGCDPTLDLRSCSAFRAQQKAAFCGGHLPRAWKLGPADTTTRIPVYLHIGANGIYGKMPDETKISRVEKQQQAFRELTTANVTAEQCIPHPAAVPRGTGHTRRRLRLERREPRGDVAVPGREPMG